MRSREYFILLGSTGRLSARQLLVAEGTQDTSLPGAPITVHLTIGASGHDQLVSQLRASGVRFNDYARRLLSDGVPIAEAPRRLAIAVLTAHDLGLAGGATMTNALAAARERGLLPCPVEAALHLRLAWRDRVVSPRITVASTRAHPDPERPRGFYLLDDAEGCWLRGYRASDDWVMAPTERLALVCPDR